MNPNLPPESGNTPPLNLFIVQEGFIDCPFIVQIPFQKMHMLHIDQNDIALVKGKKKSDTICRVQALDPSYAVISDAIIIMSPITRNNLRARVGDSVYLFKLANVPECNSVTLTLIDDNLPASCRSNLRDRYIIPYFRENEDSPIHLGNTFLASKDSLQFKVTQLQPDTFGRVNSRRTEFHLTGQTISRAEYLNYLNAVGYDDIGGYKIQLQQVRQLIEFPMIHPEIFQNLGVRPPRGVLLYGPPGTGKTLVAKAVSNEANANFILVNGPEIFSKNVGETEDNLRKIFERASRSSPCVIFFDELDSIAPNRDKADGHYQVRTVSQLLTLMDGVKELPQVIILAATNRIDTIDPALRRGGRLDREIFFGPPSVEERLEILQLLTRNMKFAADLNLREIAKETYGYVGADLYLLCAEAVYRQVDICRSLMPSNTNETEYNKMFLELFAITYDDFKFAMKKVHPSALRETFVASPSVNWSQIGGLHHVKQELRELIELPINYPELFEQLGQTPPKGILLFGPPGCGKTLLAKAIATECKANFIAVKGPELLTKYFGESAQNVRRLFTWARNSAPCVLFFDELDSVTQTRGGSDQCCSEAARVVTQLLVEMDGMEPNNNVFIVAATNRPDIIDSAILRPGRIDQLVYIPLPDFDARVGILRATLQDTFISPEVNVNNLAEATKGFSGADLAELCRRASKLAIRQQIQNGDPNIQLVLTYEHFDQALNEVQRSVSDIEAQNYDQFAQMLRRKRGI